MNFNPARLLKAYERKAKGKPPLIAQSGRSQRRTGRARFWLRLRRSVLAAVLPTDFYTKIKWRWLRGEIRDRRLRMIHLFGILTPPLRRFTDYSGIARKAFIVEPLEDSALPIYDKPEPKP